MKIKGKTKEFIELMELDASSCAIFNQPESSSLTILWFQTNDNRFIIDGKKYSFTKNQIVFFTEFHKVEVLKKGTAKYLRFNRPFFCVIDHDIEVSCKGILFFGASQLPIITIPEEEIEHFQILWKMFTIEMQSKDNLQISMLQMMLKRYLILSTRLYKKQHQFSKIKKENDIIREFNFLVEQHFNSKHTVAEYADLLFKSPKTISNIFSKIGVKTPLSYIQDRKMLEAKRLLHYSDIKVQEIAFKVGYDDIQSFSRFFKKQEGVSPSKYRENSLLG
ncbi:helix-turn-helix transcriptional regulator [Gelidibacter sp. F63206]|uniref:helix-turn-helix transcriptional regulator n=1 Tax=Gelidibacter sp. F63206 TaxID=2926425 RepID=UPI001FF30B11|nr:helix-turn-helix transcriptional regulator [Gelidibacter sp. F63206]MCK0114909.1 helix-turn-helix transcriptional regulator [Gelidibacter sp. F63206]